MILSSPLADGTYVFVAKAIDALSNVDYSAGLTVTIDTNVTANTTPDMTAATDTGASNSDNYTRDNTPDFTGHTEPNSFVELLLDGTTVIATGSADVNGDWALTAQSAIPNGTHNISSRVTDIAGNVGTSVPLSIVIDTLPPVAPTGQFDLNGVPPTSGQHMDVSFPFADDVHSSVQSTDLHLTNLTTNTTINPSDIIVNFGPGNNVYFTFNNSTYPIGILPDGNYHGFINSSDIQDDAGNGPMVGNATVDFFYLTADANHDRFVNTLDFMALAQNFNKTGMKYANGDFNYDGVVNALDFNILATNFGRSLHAAGPSAPISDLAIGGDSSASAANASIASTLFGDKPILMG